MLGNLREANYRRIIGEADLLNKAGEPLTGRKISFHLYPLAQAELSKIESSLETQQSLEERLILGSYPELHQLETFQKKSEYLLELIQSYLLKDILSFEGIRQPDKIMRLLRLIAYQVGSEVSYSELGTQLGISKNTVENYLDLQKIDLIEVRNGKPGAFEFNYSSDKKIKIPAAFASAYPDATFVRISKDNYLDWIE